MICLSDIHVLLTSIIHSAQKLGLVDEPINLYTSKALHVLLRAINIIVDE